MADHLTPERRSQVMSHVKSKDTSIEVKVRKWLYGRGYRFRKNVSTMPGKPDIVLRKYNTVIFVHGCFWHMHEGCKKAKLPKTRTDYWKEKLYKNVQRDKMEQALLEKQGWQVVVLWQCELTKHFDETMERVVERLQK